MGTWVLALGCLLAQGGSDVAEGLSAGLANAVARVEAHEITAAVAGRELAGLGPKIVPLVLHALDAGQLPVSEAVTGPAESLDPARADILLCTLACLDRAPVVAELRTLHDAGQLQADTVMRVVGAVGRANDLDLLIGVGAVGSAHELEAAVAAILQRDDGAWSIVQRRILDSEPDVSVALLRAVTTLPNAKGLEVLFELFGLQDELDLMLLTHVGRLGGKIPWAADERLRSKVREYLMSDDMQVVRGAALALGELEDSQSTRALVELIEGDSAPLKDAAHWALKRITRLSFPADARRWRSWYVTESCWFDQTATALMERIERLDAVHLQRAVDELVSHRFGRDVIAYRLETLLWHEDVIHRKLGCTALARLDTRTSVPALETMLRDRDPAVVAEALRALRSITGEAWPESTELALR